MNKSVDKQKKNENQSDDGAINDDILEGESVAGDIDERWLDDNYGASDGCGKLQTKV